MKTLIFLYILTLILIPSVYSQDDNDKTQPPITTSIDSEIVFKIQQISIGMPKQEVKKILSDYKMVENNGIAANNEILYLLKEELGKEIPESEEVIVDILYCKEASLPRKSLPLIFYKNELVGKGWGWLIDTRLYVPKYEKEDGLEEIYQEIKKQKEN